MPKIIQIAVAYPTDETHSLPFCYALDDSGQLWIQNENVEWFKVQMPPGCEPGEQPVDPANQIEPAEEWFEGHAMTLARESKSPTHEEVREWLVEMNEQERQRAKKAWFPS